MNEWKEFSAKTVEEAKKEALAFYNADEDKVEIDVVEKEAKGLLGMFSKHAVIKARLKSIEEEKKAVTEDAAKVEVKNDAADSIESSDSSQLNESIESNESNESVDLTDSTDSTETADNDNSSKKDDSNKKNLTEDEACNLVKDFLVKVFEAMEIKAEMSFNYDSSENVIEVNLEGEEMGVLIGKRGQTLDSLQYLSSLVVNKESKNYIKIKIDTENYRERRKETLENLAKNIAKKVTRTRKTCSLEPMNPYDRRIIHSALQNDKYVETHSEGEEPNRRVVITLKSGVMPYQKKKNNYRNNRYSNRYDNAKEFKKKFNENYKKSYQSITFDDIKNEDKL